MLRAMRGMRCTRVLAHNTGMAPRMCCSGVRWVFAGGEVVCVGMLVGVIRNGCVWLVQGVAVLVSAGRGLVCVGMLVWVIRNGLVWLVQGVAVLVSAGRGVVCVGMLVGVIRIELVWLAHGVVVRAVGHGRAGSLAMAVLSWCSCRRLIQKRARSFVCAR